MRENEDGQADTGRTRRTPARRAPDAADAQAHALDRGPAELGNRAVTDAVDSYDRSSGPLQDLALLGPQGVHQLQRSIGNRAVVQLLAGTRAGPAPDPGPADTNAVQRQEVRNQPYAHGAFMGAARRMVNNPRWNRILEALMPDVHADVSGVTDDSQLIPMLENNPVMAAYGMFATQNLDRRRDGGRSDRVENMKAFEWDVWLDPRVLDQMEDSRDRTADEQQAARALDEQLVDSMIIAHGDQRATVAEGVESVTERVPDILNLLSPVGGLRAALGGPGYEQVRRSRKTALGGIRPADWMDIFGRAIELRQTRDEENFNRLLERISGEERRSDSGDASLHNTFENRRSFSDVIHAFKRAFPEKETFSVLLDIKSRTPHRVIHRLVRELNQRGVHVHAVGTFVHSELTGLSRVDQQVDGRPMNAPQRIKFFHGIGNVQNACTNNEIHPGDKVMFNAGSILDSVDWTANDPDGSDSEIRRILVQLATLKEHKGFSLGIYVQEPDVDRRAARKITELSNKYSHIFDLGFAWGGISNDMGSLTSGRSGTGSQEPLSDNWQ